MKYIFVALLAALLTSTTFAQDNKEIQQQVEQAKRMIVNSGPGFGLVGKIERGHSTPYSINGEDFVVTGQTEVTGDIKVGATAEATGKIVDGRRKIAEVVVVADPHQSPSSPSDATARLR